MDPVVEEGIKPRLQGCSCRKHLQEQQQTQASAKFLDPEKHDCSRQHRGRAFSATMQVTG